MSKSSLRTPKRRKAIHVSDVKIMETRVPKEGGYNKFQKFICKLIGVIPHMEEEYLVKIRYTGQTIVSPKRNSLLINTEGIRFTVVKSISQREVYIASIGALPKRPNLYGRFYIDEKSKEADKL